MSSPRFRIDPLSDTYVKLVDIVFGFIVSQGFIRFATSIQTLDLTVQNFQVLLVYSVVLLSWLGYHQSTSRYPYNKSVWSRLRLTFDLAILVLYAFLIFQSSELGKVLFGLAIVYVAYMIAGLLRIKEWSNDRKVSKPELSFSFAVLFLVMWLVYGSVALVQWAQWVFAVLSLVAVFGYREARRRLGYPRLLIVGIDLDGVLGDQVPHILKHLQSQGKAAGLTKASITDWRYAFEGTDIATEIETALLDSVFVGEMPVMMGSTDAMKRLYPKFHLVIATSRPKETEKATVKWLRDYFKFHEYANTRDIGKENLGLDILVDDNLDNVKAFSSSSHRAILLSQPWNASEDNEVKQLLVSKRIIRCRSWQEVESVLAKELEKN